MPIKPPASDMDRQAGLRLKAAREAWLADGPIKQETFAAKMGVGRTALANWEGGKLPDVRAMVRLFAWIRVPLDWVYLGDTRHIEYEIVPRLLQRCAEIEAVVGGPSADPDFQLPTDPRIPGVKPVASVPILRRRHGTLHDKA